MSVYKWHNVDTGTLAWETSVVFFILCVCVYVFKGTLIHSSALPKR